MALDPAATSAVLGGGGGEWRHGRGTSSRRARATHGLPPGRSARRGPPARPPARSARPPPGRSARRGPPARPPARARPPPGRSASQGAGAAAPSRGPRRAAAPRQGTRRGRGGPQHGRRHRCRHATGQGARGSRGGCLANLGAGGGPGAGAYPAHGAGAGKPRPGHTLDGGRRGGPMKPGRGRRSSLAGARATRAPCGRDGRRTTAAWRRLVAGAGRGLANPNRPLFIMGFLGLCWAAWSAWQAAWAVFQSPKLSIFTILNSEVQYKTPFYM
jgi:hypothetical protein